MANLNKLSIESHDLLYRISTDNESRKLFKAIISTHHEVVSIYTDVLSALAAGDNVIHYTFIHQRFGLPVNRTIFGLTSDRKLLDGYVEQLGGYPVVIKAAGGSHGVGVIKVDSSQALYSLTDYLLASDNDYMMREYIEHHESARLIVLNGKVIDSISYTKVPGDFRTNVGENINAMPKKFGTQVNQIAIQAVSVLGCIFGGVDVIIDKNGKAYLAEVNIPCYFPRAQKLSGVDIGQKLVDALIARSKSH